MTGRQPSTALERSAIISWAVVREANDIQRRLPATLAALSDQLVQIGQAAGLSAVGFTSTKPFLDTREAIFDRIERGFQSTMAFTFSKPERSTTPTQLLKHAETLIVGAWGYRREDIPSPVDELLKGDEFLKVDEVGRVARYQWIDHYALLRAALEVIATRLRTEGWRARVVLDDNALVDRAAAHRAGLGWFGKNANLLLPELGSWFVLGSVVTDAPFDVTDTPVDDGCGTCNRCIPACPTGAIVAPGVIDANRCLAWIVQAPGDIDESLRVAMHDRIYGCDDCQDVCPENRKADRATSPAPAELDAEPWVSLLNMLQASDAELLGAFGRWYLPNRNPDILRRNAAVALGNVGDPTSAQVTDALHTAQRDGSEMVVRHATWALARLTHRSPSA